MEGPGGMVNHAQMFGGVYSPVFSVISGSTVVQCN